MITEDQINEVKEKIKQLKIDYEDEVSQEISKLKRQYRLNRNRTRLITIQDIDGDCLDCYEVRANGDDLIFSIKKISISEYLNDYGPDEDGEALETIKGIFKRISDNLGVNIKEFFEVRR